MAAGGGLLKLLDAYIAIGGDTSGYDAALTQAEAKAKASGDRISGLFTPSKVFAALATAAGAAFGLALTGANQLDAATRRLQADTGMTAAEAAKAEHALAGMYQNNLQGFDAISAAMAKVHNDLGLTGAEADATTEKFLKFSTATGIDAAQAVTSFDDVLDAFGLKATDSAMLMDKLVLSHQRFGGSVAESAASLSKLAPAMTAANMTVDDGIALLNLFNAAGIDAAKAPQALAIALSKVKSPEELKALIADISATTDPFARAAKAVDLFGQRAGPQLATALGAGTLADFTISMGEAAGATDRAAEASLSWSDKWTLVLHKVGGALADFGTQFGPLLMVAAAFGPKMLAAIAGGLGGAGALLISKIVGPLLGAAGVEAWMTTGTAIGTTIGAAMQGALLLAVPITIAAILVSVRDEWKRQTSGWGFNVPDLFSGQGALAPNAGIHPVGEQGVSNEEQIRRNAALTGAVAPTVTPTIDPAAMIDRAKRLVAEVGGILRAGLNAPIPVDQLVATFGTGLKGVMDAAHRQGHATGVESMTAMAEGIVAAEKAPLDAFTTMLALMKSELTPQAEAARLVGELTSKSLAAGLGDSRPAVRAQAIAAKEAILDRLVTIAGESGPLGKKAMDALAAGMKDADPTIRAYAKAAHDAVIAELDKTAADARLAGLAAGGAFGDGFTLGAGRKLTVGGIHVSIGGGGGLANGGPARAGVPYIVGEKRPELFIPETNGYILPSVPYVDRAMLTYVDRGQSAMSAQPGGGQAAGAREQRINIEHVEIADAHDEFSLVQSLRFLAAVQG